jgi:predicted Zn-dependent peptidase
LLLPAPGACDLDYFALRLLTEILGGGMSSRLFQEAREKRGLAYAIDAYSETYADTGVLGVYAGCAAGDADETAKVAAGEILGMARASSDAELARAKAQLKAGMFMAREQPLPGPNRPPARSCCSASRSIPCTSPRKSTP